jgi:Rod binding domain-containing protein
MSAVPAVATPDGSGPAERASPKLAKAAQEFEAILLSQWLEKMQQTFSSSDEAKDPAHDTLASLGTQAVATALAARGGIGIGTMLLRQLKGSPAGQQGAVGRVAAAGQAPKNQAPTQIKVLSEPADNSNTLPNRK